jgi:HEPN domain-containing protein
MNAPPDAQRVARRWLAKADEDLAAAERLLAIDDSLASVVCFHSQQAVEKLLKALLVVSRVPFARTHDVIQLVQMLPVALASPIPLAELTCRRSTRLFQYGGPRPGDRCGTSAASPTVAR